MDDFKKRLAHLLHCRGVGWKLVYDLLEIDVELKNLYNDSTAVLISKLSPASYRTILTDLHSHSTLDQIRQYPYNQIKIISIFDPYYPPLLKEIYQPPWILYAKGDVEILNQTPKLAVVGSRVATEYGKRAIDSLFPKLLERGIVIVSGLATGIDTLAHQTAVMNSGKTIAVLGGGFYHIYPKENKDLAFEMMRNQLVISEYPPNTKPARWQFPMRNRIISGISWGTFIIEAKSRSGSLITANLALNEGREVFALPGSIFSPYSVGTNELIQQGAKPVKCSQDIIEEIYY
ncbi:DNA-processing protein DprA [Bacillus massilinigeriensis]|uniref:DNA-processing protein DprA n=1 Tax=Bacillus massilionigeriensis TaxID=1805475 RepID=UPI00096ADF2B|nr:DNA-processing protein DprA [Bacillus massilionigeriensis]